MSRFLVKGSIDGFAQDGNRTTWLNSFEPCKRSMLLSGIGFGWGAGRHNVFASARASVWRGGLLQRERLHSTLGYCSPEEFECDYLSSEA